MLGATRSIEALNAVQSFGEQIYAENVEDELYEDNVDEDKFNRKRISALLYSGDVLLTCCYLFLLGVITAVLAFCYDLLEQKIVELHDWLSEATSSVLLNYFLYVCHTLLFATLAASVPYFVSKNGEGSGIPELKSILSGIVLHQYLSFKTLLAKFFGLVFAAGSGLFTGREGPFVCLGGCIAHMLCMLPGFSSKFLKNQSQHLSMLAAGCAVGIVSTFGAPIGGVVFSFEVTATYYLVRDLWKGFFTSVCATVVFTAIRFSGLVKVLKYTEFNPIEWDWELVAFILLGVLAGLAGAAFNVLVLLIGKYKKKTWMKQSKFRITLLVALLTGLLSFPFGSYIRNEFDESMNEMFSVGPLPAQWSSYFGGQSWSFIPTLFFFSAVRLVMVALTTNLAIPTGIFVPSLTIGAGLGRMFGECLAAYVPSSSIPPGIYAMAGAAAVCTGTTHSISTAIILLEMTGQVYHLLQVLTAVLIAYGVTNSISPSYYENALISKNIPYMPFLTFPKSVAKVAGDIMSRDVHALTLDLTLKDVADLLINNPAEIAFPVVESRERMVLRGSLQRGDLEKVLDAFGILPPDLDESGLRKWQGVKGLFGTLRNRMHLDVGRARISALDSHNPSTHDAEFPASPGGAVIELAEEEHSRFGQGASGAGSGTPAATPTSRGSTGVVEPLRVRDVKRYLPLDNAPIQMCSLAPVHKVHFYFTMLACNQIYVTQFGTLLGVITRTDIVKASSMPTPAATH